MTTEKELIEISQTTMFSIDRVRRVSRLLGDDLSNKKRVQSILNLSAQMNVNPLYLTTRVVDILEAE